MSSHTINYSSCNPVLSFAAVPQRYHHASTLLCEIVMTLEMACIKSDQQPRAVESCRHSLLLLEGDFAFGTPHNDLLGVLTVKWRGQEVTRACIVDQNQKVYHAMNWLVCAV